MNSVEGTEEVSKMFSILREHDPVMLAGDDTIESKALLLQHITNNQAANIPIDIKDGQHFLCAKYEDTKEWIRWVVCEVLRVNEEFGQVLLSQVDTKAWYILPKVRFNVPSWLDIEDNGDKEDADAELEVVKLLSEEEVALLSTVNNLIDLVNSSNVAIKLLIPITRSMGVDIIPENITKTGDEFVDVVNDTSDLVGWAHNGT